MNTKIQRWLAVGRVLAAALVGGAWAVAPAGAATLGSLVQVSGSSPWTASCGGQDSSATLYRGAEPETWVAVNPTNTNNMIAVWQQDRWSDGAAQGLGTGYTSDFASTWARTFPTFSHCGGGTAANLWGYDRATDPWVTFGPDGAAYQATFSLNWYRNESALGVSKSTDGGQTWSLPKAVAVISRSSWNVADDKESITADPTNPNNVYMVWIRYTNPPPSYRDSKTWDTLKGNALFSRSVNGGETWSEPIQITKADEAQGNQIVVLADGSLLDFFMQLTYDKKTGAVASRRIMFVRSSDKGLTWSAPQTVVSSVVTGWAYATDNVGSFIRAGDGLFDVAVDRVTNTLHVVWQDGSLTSGWQNTFYRGGAYASVAYVRSTDSGQTWTTPVRVGQSGVTPNSYATQQFTPSVAALGGKVAITYYDCRNDTDIWQAPASTDYWAVASADDGASWGSDIRLTNASFDLAQAPYARGLFLGDYQGLDAIPGGSFIAIFNAVNTGSTGPTDVFARTFAP